MKKKKPKKGRDKPVKPTPSTPVEKQDNKFDFGGLPERDLKKNLGCG
jgi:hypothetical protein